MNTRSTFAMLVVTALTAASLAGCEDKPSKPLAPTASALAPAEKPAMSQTFGVETAGSKVTFVMNAALEKIHGEAPDSMTGDLHLNLSDITKSTGLVKADLDKLTLYQQKRANEMDQYSERAKSDKQNEHARAWLEIDPKAPADTREKNRWVEFKIEQITNVKPQADITKMPGAERKITAVIVGDVRLHGRVSKKRAIIEAVFKFAGDKPSSVTIKSTAPMSVGLEEHDVRPREAFGKIAKATLDSLGSKVAKDAPIELQFSAKAK
jgi:hypothetical protein